MWHLGRSVRIWEVWRCRRVGAVVLRRPGVLRAVERVVLVGMEVWTCPGSEEA